MNEIFKLFIFFITTLTFVKGRVFEPKDFSKWALSIQAGEFDFDRPNSGVPVVTTTTTTPLLKPEVYSFHIHSEIRYRYCRTNVISKVINLNLQNSTEVTFQVVLPNSAFISKFSMEIDDKIYKAYVKEKEKAKQIYTDAKERGQSAGLVEVNARDANVFNVNVNIKPNAKITFNLIYEELLTRKLGYYEHVISVNSEEISQIKDYKISVNIIESQNISLLRVPNLRNDIELIEDNEGNNVDVIIQRPTGKSANISWTPTDRDQIRMIEQGIRGKFIIQYDINRESDAGEILLMNGYFVHFFTPKDILPLQKHVIFVLDISGSMYGRKMEQLKSAILFVLDDMKPDDYFNIITFSSSVKVWSPEKNKGSPRSSSSSSSRRVPLLANEKNVRKARSFINKLSPSGGTNINAALREALTICDAVKFNSTIQNPIPPIQRSKRESFIKFEKITDENDDEITPTLPSNVESTIIFLTDGQPTVGLTNPESIITNIKETNTNLSIPIFSLAFGNSADFNFIKKLSLQNNGFGRKIYEASDADLQMKGFYKEISSPLLSNISFQYTTTLNNYTITKLTTQRFSNIFNGSEITIAGRIKSKKYYNEITTLKPIEIDEQYSMNLTSTSTIVIPIIAVDIGANGRDGKISYNQYDIFENDISIPKIPRRPKNDSSFLTVATTIEDKKEIEDEFLERLWAYLTIKQLIDKSLADEKMNYIIEDDDDDDDSDEKNNNSKSDENDDDDDKDDEKKRIPEPSKPDEGVKARALRLALKYGFVTSLTSLVVVKPNDTINGIRNNNNFIDDDSINLVQAKPISDSSTNVGSTSSMPGMPSPIISSRSYINRGLSAARLRGGGSSSRYNNKVPKVVGGDESYRMRFDSYNAPQPMRMHSFVDNIPESLSNRPANFLMHLPGRIMNPDQIQLPSRFESIRHSEISIPSTRRPSSFEKKTIWDLNWYHSHMNFVIVNETRYWIEKSIYDQIEIPSYECTIRNSSSLITTTMGECEHLGNCIQNEFISHLNVYIQTYFCPLRSNIGNNFAGVCCPKNFKRF